MADPAIQLHCYVCHRVVTAQQSQILLNDAQNVVHRIQVAVARRAQPQMNLPQLEPDLNSRLCFPCSRSIAEEIEIVQRDPLCLKLNIVLRRQGNHCSICNAAGQNREISTESRGRVFLEHELYIPKGARFCMNHLNEDRSLKTEAIPYLRFINRACTISGKEMLEFLKSIRNSFISVSKKSVEDETHFSNEEFQVVSPITKQQFTELFTFCDPVPVPNSNRHRIVRKKDLLTFLCKLRQNLSDEFLQVFFGYSSRQAVSMAISKVRKSLMMRFVPTNIGLRHITKALFIERHVTEFANELYNPSPNEKRGILFIDGTYSYLGKCSNFRELRQTFCLHKHAHLVKPMLLVAPDGYILAIIDPFFSDHSNNDAAMLRHEIERDESLREWLGPGDITVLDRGFRDVLPLLDDLGVRSYMPHLLPGNRNQFTTVEANENRIITIMRWIVEARNGHFRSLFKFFANTIIMPHVPNLGDFYNIAGAIINCYHQPIHMEGADAELARSMLERKENPNVVQQFVEVHRLLRGNAQWEHLIPQQVADFPRLTIPYLKSLNLGTFQLNLAPSYVQDKLQRDDDEEFQLDLHVGVPGLIRVRLYSRFRNATRHQIFVSYVPDNEDENGNDIEEEPILGYYCTCKSGARTLGACAHVTSILWYLGYGRHENVRYPPTALLRSIRDAADRPLQEEI